MGVRDLLGRVIAKVSTARDAPGRSAPPKGPTPSEAPRREATGAVPGAARPVGRLDLAPPGPGLEEGLEVEVPVPGSILVDVREPGELASGVAVGALLLPMDALPHHLHELPRDRALTIYCAAGARSAGVAHWLREQGWSGAVSLAGGIGALRFGGVEVAVPPGVRPGTKLTLPELPELGPGRQRGEVVEQRGDRLRVRVWDAQGFQALVEVDAASVSS